MPIIEYGTGGKEGFGQIFGQATQQTRENFEQKTSQWQKFRNYTGSFRSRKGQIDTDLLTNAFSTRVLADFNQYESQLGYELKNQLEETRRNLQRAMATDKVEDRIRELQRLQWLTELNAMVDQLKKSNFGEILTGIIGGISGLLGNVIPVKSKSTNVSKYTPPPTPETGFNYPPPTGWEGY